CGVAVGREYDIAGQDGRDIAIEWNVGALPDAQLEDVGGVGEQHNAGRLQDRTSAVEVADTRNVRTAWDAERILCRSRLIGTGHGSDRPACDAGHVAVKQLAG